MRVVMANHRLTALGGSETYLMTVAEQLERLGHDVVLHAQEHGDAARVAAQRGLRVAENIHKLPPTCDAVLVQDAAAAYELGERYPEARVVLVVHSPVSELQAPPQMAGVVDAVVVLNDRVGRRVRAMPGSGAIIRLRQPIDLDRFGLLGVKHPKPRRAILFGNDLLGLRFLYIAQGLAQAGIALSVIGRHGRVSEDPTLELADADIVVGTGRCILEAMACGKPAYVCGPAGIDGWVTPELYPDLEADGFSGAATDRVAEEQTLREEIQEFDLSVTEGNRDLVRLHHDARKHGLELAEVLGAGREGARDGALPADELARLVRLEWLSESRARDTAIENKALRYRLETLARDNTLLHARTRGAEERLVEARAARAQLEQRVAYLQRYEDFATTRRYRTALALARPVEFVRRLSRRLRRRQAAPADGP